MPNEDSIAYKVFQGFCSHARECGMDKAEMDKACVPFFKGAFEALSTDDRTIISRMIWHATKRGFVSFGQLVQPVSLHRNEMEFVSHDVV